MIPIVSFDFDGVIHSYTSGWKGQTVIPDPPVPGIKEAIERLHERGFEIAIVSSRMNDMNGVFAVKEYLRKHDIPFDRLCQTKPPAFVHIDDRCICFDGKPENLYDAVMSFEPWYKERMEWRP